MSGPLGFGTHRLGGPSRVKRSGSLGRPRAALGHAGKAVELLLAPRIPEKHRGAPVQLWALLAVSLLPVD